MMTAADRELIDYVQKMIRTGTTTMEMPAELLENASPEAVREVRALCKINGVEISGIRV